jgi:hypothetical protein
MAKGIFNRILDAVGLEEEEYEDEVCMDEEDSSHAVVRQNAYARVSAEQL